MALLRLGVAALCFCACGSPDSNALTHTGATGSTGSSSSQTTGGASAFGYGGTIPGGGGIAVASGGFQIGAGGVVSTGGLLEAGGSPFGSGGALTTDSGIPNGSGGTDPGSGGAGTGGESANPFPAGGLISQACSDCARTNCRTEEEACAADSSCVAIGQCLSTCFLSTCLICFPSLSNPNFTAVSNCTDQNCQGTCPRINGGGGINP